MADPVSEALTDALKQNLTENAVPAKVPATPEGIAIAYGSIVVMAVFPIFFGAYRSVKLQKKQKTTGQSADVMTKGDAMRFPLIASAALFGLYLVFKSFSKENINLVISAYFVCLGVAAVAHLLSPILDRVLPKRVPKIPYHLLFTSGNGSATEPLIDFHFTTYDIGALVLSTLIGAWYLHSKHWIANNLFGLAFSINGIEMLHLNSFAIGSILLGGLFFYDIFWVFGTDVMVTVARNFDAPIKLVFPQDLLTKGLAAQNFAMLGLGDIVIPGIFIALLLRFDISLGRKGSNVYFWATYGAYVGGLLLTLVILHTFKHAQPVLLYLVPLCLSTPLLVALIKGDLKRLFDYVDFPENAPEKKSKKSKKAAVVAEADAVTVAESTKTKKDKKSK